MVHSGRVLIAAGGDFTLPAGEQADFVMVVDGTAQIDGQVDTILIVDATTTLTGASAETLIAISSQVTVGDGTTISRDLWRLDSQVQQLGSAEVASMRDLGAELMGLGLVLAPALFLLWIGFAIAAIAIGLLAAALAARQLRAGTALINREPVQTVLTAIVATILPVLVIAGLVVTIVGAPLALAIVFFIWPLAAFFGYLVAAVWIGDWVVARMTPGTIRERPYLASVVGIVILQVAGIIPIVHFIATFLGYGAVVLLAWRTFTSGRPAPAPAAGPQPQPIAG
jgi:hypothetical protein